MRKPWPMGLSPNSQLGTSRPRQLPAQTPKWPCWLWLSSLFPSGWTPPPAWASCALPGSVCLWDLCFMSLLLSEQAHVAAIATMVPAQRPWGRGRMSRGLFPCQSQTRASSQGPGDWSHCPALAPPTPAVSGHLFFSIPPAVTLQAAGWGEARGRVP